MVFDVEVENKRGVGVKRSSGLDRWMGYWAGVDERFKGISRGIRIDCLKNSLSVQKKKANLV